MAEKPGYWDLHRCAWVDAEPDDMGLPVPETVAAKAISPPRTPPSPSSAPTWTRRWRPGLLTDR